MADQKDYREMNQDSDTEFIGEEPQGISGPELEGVSGGGDIIWKQRFKMTSRCKYCKKPFTTTSAAEASRSVCPGCISQLLN